MSLNNKSKLFEAAKVVCRELRKNSTKAERKKTQKFYYAISGLAKKLEMKEDERWLEKEVNGYTEYLNPDEESKTGLKFKKQEKENQHRRIQAELNIGLKNGHIEKFDIPMFISESLRQIEDWANKHSNQNQIIMNAPPMEIMVKNLNVNPNKSVPYLVNPQSFKRIINEVRQKIIEFTDRAKKNI